MGFILFYLGWFVPHLLRVAVCVKYDEWYDRYEPAKWGDSTSSFDVRLRLWYGLLKAQMREEVNFSFIAVIERNTCWGFFFLDVYLWFLVLGI